jgi:hypothetical protein
MSDFRYDYRNVTVKVFEFTSIKTSALPAAKDNEKTKTTIIFFRPVMSNKRKLYH